MYISSMINADIYKYKDENQAIEALREQLVDQLEEDGQDLKWYDFTVTKVQHGMVMKAKSWFP